MKRKTNKRWSNEEVNFLIECYQKYSCKECAKKLNLSTTQIQTKILNLKSHNVILTKRNYVDNVNINDYNSKIGAYILGYIWADGYIPSNEKRVVLKINKNDGDEIKKYFINNWKEYNFKCCLNTITLNNNSKIFYDFLVDNDFKDKSNKSPDKILNFLSDDYKKYFYLGVIDGDGSFYLNMKYGLRHFEVSSTYEQDWMYFENLCLQLNIKHKIVKISKINKLSKKENKSSSFRIIGKEILKLGNFIYSDEIIGLKRKYNKFINIKNSYGYNKSNRNCV